MVSPRHYNVDPMLSASGNLFKCHEEGFFLFFYLLYWYSYIVYFVCAPASEFGARPKGGGGGDSFLFI